MHCGVFICSSLSATKLNSKGPTNQIVELLSQGKVNDWHFKDWKVAHYYSLAAGEGSAAPQGLSY